MGKTPYTLGHHKCQKWSFLCGDTQGRKTQQGRAGFFIFRTKRTHDKIQNSPFPSFPTIGIFLHHSSPETTSFYSQLSPLAFTPYQLVRNIHMLPLDIINFILQNLFSNSAIPSPTSLHLLLQYFIKSAVFILLYTCKGSSQQWCSVL